MERVIELPGETLHIDFIFPPEINEFIKRNELSTKEIADCPHWKVFLAEDLDHLERKPRRDLEIVVHYIHITSSNRIFLNAFQYSKKKQIANSDLPKGAVYKDISFGYAVFE